MKTARKGKERTFGETGMGVMVPGAWLIGISGNFGLLLYDFDFGYVKL